MRADLIERLRHRADYEDEPDFTIFDAEIMREAADALASQEPVAWRTRGMDALSRWLPWVMISANKADLWRKDPSFKNGRREIEPLFASPVVPVAAKAEAEGWRPTHRHLKSGHLVRVIGIGKMQSGSWLEPVHIVNDLGSHTAHIPVDMREVVIYEHGVGLWARPRDEFEDGRFEPVPTGKGDGQP